MPQNFGHGYSKCQCYAKNHTEIAYNLATYEKKRCISYFVWRAALCEFWKIKTEQSEKAEERTFSYSLKLQEFSKTPWKLVWKNNPSSKPSECFSTGRHRIHIITWPAPASRPQEFTTSSTKDVSVKGDASFRSKQNMLLDSKQLCPL